MSVACDVRVRRPPSGNLSALERALRIVTCAVASNERAWLASGRPAVAQSGPSSHRMT